jgi:Mg/Co/Ni transporter MgtE
VGIVTIDDVLDVAEEEATEDIHKLGGMEALDEPYMQITFLRMVRKRAGWLVMLFLGEMLTATAMGFFQREIERAVVLALFIPLMISSGGNSGSQAATLVIRALALSEVDSQTGGVSCDERSCQGLHWVLFWASWLFSNLHLVVIFRYLRSSLAPRCNHGWAHPHRNRPLGYLDRVHLTLCAQATWI